MLGNLRKTLQYCRRKTFFIYLAVKKWHDIFMMKLLQWKDVNSVYRTLRVLLHANLLNDRSMSSFTCTYTTGKEKKNMKQQKWYNLDYKNLLGHLVKKGKVSLHSQLKFHLLFSGANSIFLRHFFDKKYALPYRVIDAVVYHFLRWA